MADFKTAYEKVKKWEGNHAYAILKGDDGGETFAGISRVYVPEWAGWAAVDAFKKKQKNGVIKNGTKIPEAAAFIEPYYEEYIWRRKGKCHMIVNQQLANLVFDACVQHGKAARIINTCVIALGGKVKMVPKIVNGHRIILPINDITNDTLNYLNSMPARMYSAIWNAREEYYRDHHDWALFGKGWMNRLNDYPKKIE